MKTASLFLCVALSALLLSLARQRTETEWVTCYLHPVAQPLVFIATISGEGGRYLFERQSGGPDWLPNRLSVSALGLSGGRLPEIGRRYRVSGRAVCRAPHLWPSRNEPLLIKRSPEWSFQLANLVEMEGAAPWRTRFLNWLFAPLVGFPRLHGLAQATWTGQTFYQSPALVEAFRSTGLMAILALSGEHVAVFLALVEWGAAAVFGLLFPLVKGKWLREPLTHLIRGWRLGKWSFGAGLLLWTSGGLPSMKRTWWMAVFFLLLKLRSLRTSAVQWLFSTFAVVLLFDPRLALSPGFLLSAVATYTLFQISDLTASPGKTWRAAVLISFLVPLFTWPWTIHLFSQVAIAGPFTAAVCGGVWATVFLPAGFFSPLLLRLLPLSAAEILGKAMERSLAGTETALAKLLPWLRKGLFTVPGLSLPECVAAEMLLIAWLVWWTSAPKLSARSDG